MPVYKEISKYIDDECLIVSHGEYEGVDIEKVEKWLEQHFEIKRKPLGDSHERSRQRAD